MAGVSGGFLKLFSGLLQHFFSCFYCRCCIESLKDGHIDGQKNVLVSFFSTDSKLCGFPETEIKSIMNELTDGLCMVIDRVGNELPSSFPAEVAESVFTGMSKAKDRLVRSC